MVNCGEGRARARLVENECTEVGGNLALSMFSQVLRGEGREKVISRVTSCEEAGSGGVEIEKTKEVFWLGWIVVFLMWLVLGSCWIAVGPLRV